MNLKHIISIITPSYNQGQFIAETIESVISQKGDFFIDYIIMDGESNDNTIEIIKKYDISLKKSEYKIQCLGIEFRWFSEKDNGHADAINKGFKIAKGEIIAFLNSDDTYEQGCLETVNEVFTKNISIEIVYGQAFYINEHSELSGFYSTKDININSLFEHCYICQPALFMRKEVFHNVGEFNINIGNSIDYEYWLRAYFVKKIKFLMIRPILACSRMYNQNKTMANRTKILLEYFVMMNRYNDFSYYPYWIDTFVAERSILMKILRIWLRLNNKFYNLFLHGYSKIFILFYKNKIKKLYRKVYPDEKYTANHILDFIKE